MPRRPLIWPFAGRADEAAHSDQPNYTTRQAKNVRNRDPVSGRLSGATRSGMVKWNETVIGSTRIKALASTAIDSRTTEYDFSTGDVDVEWSRATPSATDCLGVVTDRQGNVYALDGGAGIVKFNSAGKQLYKIALPVADQAHIVRALWVDEADRIFAGVSEGGDERTAAIWCVLQLQDNEYSILWTLTPGAYTESLQVYRGSQLYAAHNYASQKIARVVIYERIGLEPAEVGRVESVAYPISGMVLGADGSMYCSSPSVQVSTTSTFTRTIAAGRATHPPIEGWKPTDLDDAAERIWSWYAADELDETDVEQTGSDPEFKEGQQILRWRDKSGNDRHWYSGILNLAGEAGPQLRRVGIGGKPCLFFQNSGTTKNSLTTYGNASVTKALAHQQRTAFPAYTDAMWCVVMLIRPTRDDDAGTPSPRTVLTLENQAATGSDHVLFVNRNAETAIPGTYVEDSISYYAETDNTGDAGGSGTVPPHSNEFSTFTTFGSDKADGAVLVSIIWDGGIDPNDTNSTRCVFRVNGRPVDRFEGLPFESLLPNWLGLAPASVFATGTAVERRFQGEIAEMIVLDRRDRNDTSDPDVLTHDKYEPAVTADNTDQTDNELAQLEAWMAYRWGCGNLLRNNQGAEVGYRNYTHFYARNSITFGAGTALVGGPPKPSVGGLYAPFGHVLNHFALLSKHDSQGVLKWVWNWATHDDTTSAGGVGLGVAARKVDSDEKVHVWSCGNQPANSNSTLSASTIDVRKVIDEGDTFSGATADGAWKHTFSGAVSLEYANPRLAADKFGNLFLPGYNAAAGIHALTVFSKDPDGGGLGQVRHTETLTGSSDKAYAVAIPPDELTPDYRDDLTEEIAEVAYIAATAQPEESLYKLRLVTTSAVASGSPREVVTLAVVEDDIRKVTASTSVIPTGGTAVIDAAAQYVQAFRAGEDIVILDGTRVLAYKLRDGTIEVLTSTSAGEVPNRPRLGMFWRHRLVLALDGGKYSASRLGNIRDWNLNPGVNIAGQPLQTATQAFNGTLTRAGEAEDSIVAMIPVWDDLAFLVGESKILRITGDPQDGGQIHLVTDSMGGVFGDSWCKDDQGRVFLWGNKPPGLYQLRPEGDPIPLSTRTLEASEFEAIDYSTHRIVLAWDPIERGVRIWQVAWETSTIASGWFWEERTHRLVRVPPIWQDKINAVGKQVTAYAFLGGDDTRALLIGCEDGYIRQFSPTARDDDGTAIDSLALIEVTGGLPEGTEYRLREVSVTLADDQEGCRLEVFASGVADSIGPIQAAFDLSPGRNVVRTRVKGAHIWVRLRNAATGRWRFEEGSVDLVPAGRF